MRGRCAGILFLAAGLGCSAPGAGARDTTAAASSAGAAEPSSPLVCADCGVAPIVMRPEFEPGSAALNDRAVALLAVVAEQLRDHGSGDLGCLRVEGHAEASEPNRRALAGARAGAVVRWLTAHGVSVERLEIDEGPHVVRGGRDVDFVASKTACARRPRP